MSFMAQLIKHENSSWNGMTWTWSRMDIYMGLESNEVSYDVLLLFVLGARR